MNILLDFSFMYEGYSGMSVDTINIHRVLSREYSVSPLVWSNKSGVNRFLSLRKLDFESYIRHAPIVDRSAVARFSTLLQLIKLCVHGIEWHELNSKQKARLVSRFLAKILPAEAWDTDVSWWIINPPSNIFYEVAKYLPARVLDRVCGMYKRRYKMPKQFDIVLYQYPKFLLFKGAKHVVRIQDVYPMFYPESIPPGAKTGQTRWFSMRKLVKERWPFVYVVPTKYTQTQLHDFDPYFKGRTFVVHPNIQFASRDKLFTKSQALEFLYKRGMSKMIKRYLIQVGTVQPMKNHMLTLQMFKELKRLDPYLGLVLVGGEGWGDDKVFDEIDRLRRKGDLVWLWGLDTKSLYSLIKNAEVLLFPSKDEGVGLPPLEAVYLGTPIVVSDIPVFRETVGSVAVFFKLGPGSVSRYVKAVQQVLNSREQYAQKVVKSREQVLSPFSDTNVLAEYNTVFKRIMQQEYAES